MPIIVIQPPKVDRGYRLVERLQELGFTDIMRMGVGPEILANPTVRELLDQRGARMHSGAALTGEQVACFVSHQTAQGFGADLPENEWIIVLEDDAQVGDEFQAFAVALSRLTYDRPAVISLFSDGRVVHSRRQQVAFVGPSRVRLLRFPPAYAVGYAINGRACRLSRNYQAWPIFTRADWPPWAALADFFIADPCIVAHRPGESTMAHVSASPKGLRRVARGLTKVAGLQFLARPQSFRGQLPLYWRHALRPSLIHALDMVDRMRSGPR